MPALRLFGRRFHIATDDVPWLAIIPALFHTAWAIGLSILWGVLGRPKNCHYGVGYEVDLAGLLAAFVLSAAVQLWMVWDGLKGSMFETRKRRWVEYLMYVEIGLLAVELGFVVYGTILLYQRVPVCFTTQEVLWTPNGVMHVAIWTTWAILALMILTLVLAYNLFPDYSDQKSWERRCWCVTLVCCCQFQRRPEGPNGERAPYARLAELFVQVFGQIDLTLSDVIVAAILAGQAQRCKRHRLVRHIVDAVDAREQVYPNGMLGDGSQHRDGARSDGSIGEVVLDISPAYSDEAMLAEMQQCSHEAGLTRTNSKPLHLLTPSGLAAELRPDWNAEEAAHQQGSHYEAVSEEDVLTAAHFCRFAFAAYGYMLLIWSQPQPRALCKLCCGRKCGLWCGSVRRYWSSFQTRPRMPDINLFKVLNREAIQQMTGLPDRDVVFVRFVGESPVSDKCLAYFIAVDHKTRSVVVAIRGTLSLEDCLTDALCEPAELDDWIKEIGSEPRGDFDSGAPPVQRADRDSQTEAHAGILDCAKAVVADLQHTKVLRSLLEYRDMGPHCPRPAQDCRGWNVVVTGHSLGAGVAVLVGLYARNFFEGTKVWAFSPPGGLADPRVADAVQEFCTSVLIGKDWIPRLTLGTFERFRDQMIMAACRCKLNKSRVVWGVLTGHRWREEELFRPESDVAEEAAQMLQMYKARLTHSRSAGEQSRMASARSFVPPGRLIFLRPVKVATRTNTTKRKYNAVWIKAQDLLAEGILVSPRMMADHMPDYLNSTLQKLARSRRRHGNQGAHADEGSRDDLPDMMDASTHDDNGDDSGSERSSLRGGANSKRKL